MCKQKEEPKVPSSLYKYYPPRCYNFDVFRHNQLYFNKTTYGNDPFDCSPELVTSFDGFMKKYHYDKQSIKATLAKHGICCFSEDPDNMHLWSLYAENFSGFALEFDGRKINALSNTCNEPFELLRVDYRDTPLDLNNNNSEFTIFGEYGGQKHKVGYATKRGERDPHAAEYLFKYLHLCKERKTWQIENEWRIIFGNIAEKSLSKGRSCLHSVSENGYLVDLPKGQNIIKSVIVGHKATTSTMTYIDEIVAKNNVPVKQTKPTIDKGKWRIEITDYGANY